ncbi:MAG: hypothetical protein H0W87_04005 [Actinobacteria bacterium]|nr:hypothetical protein [Actinomycetota bacterium]
MSGLDAWVPEWDIAARYEIALPLSPERALALTLGLPAGADPISRILLGARGMRANSSIERFFARHRFEVLEQTSTVFVVGASGRPWLSAPVLRPFAESEPVTVRVAADLRTVPAGSRGCLLATETRIVAMDDAARRLFSCYWTVVGPLSGLLRRRWLRAAAEAAARS